MSAAALDQHLADRLPEFWRLQRLARVANMRLTSDGERLHLRDADGNDKTVADLAAASREINLRSVGGAR